MNRYDSLILLCKLLLLWTSDSSYSEMVNEIIWIINFKNFPSQSLLFLAICIHLNVIVDH